MKTLIALLCSSIVTCAQVLNLIDPALVAKGNAVVTGGAPAPTYILEDDFEGPGYESGSWTESSGADVDDQYSGANVIEGTYSLTFYNTATERTTQSPAFSAMSEAWGFFKIRVNADVLAVRKIMAFQGASERGSIRLDATEHLVVYQGTGTATTTDALSIGTVYDVWWYYKTGDGGALVDAWVEFAAEDGTPQGSGTKYAEVADGSNTSTMTSIIFYCGGSMENYHDHVRVDDVAIGASPP